MKRTTVFLTEELEYELRALARQQGRPTASLVREALARYVAAGREQARPDLSFVAVGHSGRPDTSVRHEEDLWTEPYAPAPANATTRPRRRRDSTGRKRK
jgi:hypothetical protein